MNELGFILDKEGNVSYFGEWVELPNNRHQFHTYSFEDEIENTEYFKSLNISYKKK